MIGVEGEASPVPAHDPWSRQAVRSFIELFALAGLAVTQPLLDVFGRAPDLFLFLGASRTDIVLFAVLVSVVPATLLWSIEQVVGLATERGRQVTHAAFVGLLVLLLGLGSLKQAELSGPALVVLAAALAVVGVLAFRRSTGVRTWVRYLGLAPLLFVGLFLATSQTSDLLSSQDVASADIGPVDDPRSVVFLQFDEWPLQTLVDREGRIDSSLYPNLSALAADGVWYRNATTPANYTTYAVPANVTGRVPVDDRTAVASEYPETLFTMLAGQFDLDVIETVTRLCPSSLCDGDLVDNSAGDSTGTSSALGRLLTAARKTFRAMVSPDPEATSSAQAFGSGLLDPEAAVQAAGDSSAGGLRGQPRHSLQTVEDLVESIEPGESPTLHYLHLVLPHGPYDFLPDGRRYTGGPGPQAEGLRDIVGRSDQVAEVDFLEQRLVLQAAFTDRIIGQVMDRLREADLYDEAIVIATADHGIGLEPGGPARVLESADVPTENLADTYYVPLVIKAPGLGPAGTVSDANVGTIDIVPTIVAALGFQLPWPVDGIDLGFQERPDAEKRVGVVTGGIGAGTPTLSGEVTFDGETQLAVMLSKNIDTLLRPDNPAYRPFAISDAGEIVGRRPEELTITSPSGASAVVHGLDAFEHVDLASGSLPAYLMADLDVAGTAEPTVAVVLNGRVAAVSPSWSSGGSPHHLEAMLVPDFFRQGANQLEIYLVGGPEGERTLTPVEVTP